MELEKNKFSKLNMLHVIGGQGEEHRWQGGDAVPATAGERDHGRTFTHCQYPL